MRRHRFYCNDRFRSRDTYIWRSGRAHHGRGLQKFSIFRGTVSTFECGVVLRAGLPPFADGKPDEDDYCDDNINGQDDIQRHNLDLPLGTFSADCAKRTLRGLICALRTEGTRGAYHLTFAARRTVVAAAAKLGFQNTLRITIPSIRAIARA
jgi:hypothetical protein